MKVYTHKPIDAEILLFSVSDLAPDPDLRLLNAAADALRQLKAIDPGYRLSSVVLHPEDNDYFCSLAMTVEHS